MAQRQEWRGAPDPGLPEGQQRDPGGDADLLAAPPPPFSPRPPTWADTSRDYRPAGLPLEHTGVARKVETGVLTGARWVDHLQSRIAPIAFAYAVFKKYSDDEGSRLAALMAYYTFLSLFPLAIGGVALLNLFLSNYPNAVEKIISEVVPDDYQQQILDAYAALPTSGTALWIALIGLLLAGTGGVFAFYATVNQVFAVPYRYRYGFGPRYARVLIVILIMAIGVLIAAVGGLVVGAVVDLPGASRISVFLLTAGLVAVTLFLSVKILSRRLLGVGEVLLGALLGGLVVSGVVSLGSSLVSAFIASSSAVYGVFATAIGLISVILLAANGVVFSLEISVVRAWQLWPRGIDIHLLYPADERAYALLSLMDERMPSQRNDIRFDAEGHFDPRRPPFDTLDQRQPGLPLSPYDPGYSPNSSTS